MSPSFGPGTKVFVPVTADMLCLVDCGPVSAARKSHKAHSEHTSISGVLRPNRFNIVFK
jgi:hypothetical protein